MGGGGAFGPSGVAYLTSQVVDGVEDYLARGGERPGRWAGTGADRLGLTGQVTRDELAGVFDNDDTIPVLAVTRPPATRHSGYHQSLSPPKSVSVLWALGDEHVTATVEAAHAAAVDATVAWLETHAAFARQGRGGRFQIDTTGLTVAVFDHRTSRAMDPQLHSHLLIANRVERATDGAWRGLDSAELWRNLKPSGVVYQAAIRAELTARLGVVWGRVSVDGQADVIGVPAKLLTVFSGRAATIDRVLAERIGLRQGVLGRDLTAREREQLHRQVTLDTRRAKDPDPITTADLRARWATVALEAGCPFDAWQRDILGRGVGQLALALPEDLTVEQRAAIVDALGEAKSVWGRADVVNRVAPHAPTGLLAGDAVAAWVDRNVDLVLADTGVVPLAAAVVPLMPAALCRADGRPWHEHHGAARYTTALTLEREQLVMDAFTAGHDTGVAVVPRRIVKAACASSGLDVGQAAAIERLLTSGDRIAVLVGPAGTGKTTALAAAATAWATASYNVHAVAPSAVAAGVLAADTGLQADTLAHWLHTNRAVPDVVVCDEAGMVSTRDLHALATRCAAAGAQLVLVGDPAQLGSVDAGGLFPLLARDAAELERVHRFRQTWEGPASFKLRDGDASAIDTYSDRGRLTEARTPADAIERAVALWREQPDTLLLAADRDTVAVLAHAVRAERIAAGDVEPGGTLTASGQTIGVGDRIVTLNNERTLVTTGRCWVRNGDTWTVEQRHPDGALTVTHHSRGRVTLPAGYVDEHVGLGYALTVHKAQGVTVDRAVLIASESISPELLYVGLTRGREHNYAIVDVGPGDTAVDLLRAALGHRRDTPAAIVAQSRAVATGASLATLVPLHRQVRALMADAGSDPTRDLERARRSMDHAVADLARAQAAAVDARAAVPATSAALTAAGRVRDHACGPVASRVRPARARDADQTYDAVQRRYATAIERADRADRDVRAAADRFASARCRVDRLEADLVRWQAWHTAHPDVATAARALADAIGDRVSTIRTTVGLAPGPHLTRILGPCPDRWRHDHDTWLDPATAIEVYRETWCVPAGEVTRPPVDRAQHRAWTAAVHDPAVRHAQAQVQQLGPGLEIGR